MGATPWLADQRYGYIPYFMSLAFVSIYLGAHRGLVREDRENFTLKQSAAAPFALSLSLLTIYLVIKYTNFDLASLVGAYFWLLGSLAVASNVMLPLSTAAGALTEAGAVNGWAEEAVLEVPVPEGLAVDRVMGEPVRVLPITAAAAASGLIGVAAASADVALGHGNHTLNNFLACCIVADFLSLIGLGSFTAAGALLVGNTLFLLLLHLLLLLPTPHLCNKPLTHTEDCWPLYLNHRDVLFIMIQIVVGWKLNFAGGGQEVCWFMTDALCDRHPNTTRKK